MTAFSCKDRTKETNTNNNVYSRNQQYLFDLLDNYKSEYLATKRQDLKATIQTKYLEKFRYFLVDSSGRNLDSMNVTG